MRSHHLENSSAAHCDKWQSRAEFRSHQDWSSCVQRVFIFYMKTVNISWLRRTELVMV